MTKLILFFCNENSARSQMVEAFFNFYNKNPKYFGISAGTQPAGSIQLDAIKVMSEKGIDLLSQRPKKLTVKMIQEAERIYTMGCVKCCPVTLPQRTIDWRLKDPTRKSIV